MACAFELLCVDCLEQQGIDEPEAGFGDAGECTHCLRVDDVYDLDLIALYRGLGLDAGFVGAHLPRLRVGRFRSSGGPNAEPVSFETVGRELRRHALIGPCGVACQGYGDEVRSRYRYGDDVPTDAT